MLKKKSNTAWAYKKEAKVSENGPMWHLWISSVLGIYNNFSGKKQEKFIVFKFLTVFVHIQKNVFTGLTHFFEVTKHNLEFKQTNEM